MAEALKTMFFTRAFFDDLAGAVASVYPAFDSGTFIARIYDGEWDNRELKQRMRHATLTLHSLLPDDYRAALDILARVVAELPDYGFEKALFPDYVEVYGLDDWEASLPALELFTQHMSAEFAVRPFILQDQERMIAQMLVWSKHESENVRRLASEGSRPRLPWAIALPALKADPSPILPVLEQLKCDPSETVRRSVANNLNDIAKDHPQVVIDTLRRWQNDASAEMQALTAHALRTLVKAGHPDALALLGFGDQPQVIVSEISVEPPGITIGESVTFTFVLESTAETPQDLMIDYSVHFVRANGKRNAKVFKLAKRTLAPGELVHFRKTHSFKPITTRRYYPGVHTLEIQINGVVCGKSVFVLGNGK